MINSYSTLNTIYIFITLTSVISLIILIIIILKSPDYITKWTLFQLCIAALGLSIASLPTIIIYGDDILEKAPTTMICKVQCRAILFFFYPLFMLSIILPFYLCGILNRNFHLEKKSFLISTFLIWGFSIGYSSFVLIGSRYDPNKGVVATTLYCEARIRKQWYYLWIYQMITWCLAFIVVMLTFYSAIILYQRWWRFHKNQNRKTAIQLGYAVRLCTYTIVYTVIIGCYVITDIIQPLETKDGELINRYRISDFTSGTIGILLLLIFGRSRKAAICLPNCYHAPPIETFRSPPSLEIDGDNHIRENKTSSIGSPKSISPINPSQNVASSSSSSSNTFYTDMNRNFHRNSFNVTDILLDDENEPISNLFYFGPDYKRHIRRLTV